MKSAASPTQQPSAEEETRTSLLAWVAETATNAGRPSNSLRIHVVMVLAFTLSMYRDIAGHEELTGKIIECGIRVHEIFGPGLLESVYRPCLTLELR